MGCPLTKTIHKWGTPMTSWKPRWRMDRKLMIPSWLVGSFGPGAPATFQICWLAPIFPLQWQNIPNLRHKIVILLLVETQLWICFRPTPDFCWWCIHFCHGPKPHRHQPLTSTRRSCAHAHCLKCAQSWFQRNAEQGILAAKMKPKVISNRSGTSHSPIW